MTDITLGSIVRHDCFVPPKTVLYAIGGWGKTTLAAGAEKPVFLFSERGRGQLAVDAVSPHADPDLPPEQQDYTLHSWDELLASIKLLYKADHDFKTLVIDTMGGFSAMAEAAVCQENGVESLADIDYGHGHKYYLPAKLGIALDGLDRLRDRRGMAIIILMHAKQETIRPPDVQPFSRYNMDAQPAAASLIHNWADMVLFGSYRRHTKSDGKHFGKELVRAVGSGKRFLLSETRPWAEAKCRYRLPIEMEIPDPNKTPGWPVIWKAIKSADAHPEPEVVEEVAEDSDTDAATSDEET